MRKIIKILIAILFVSCTNSDKVDNTTKKIRVGILNTISHPSLELVQSGIIEKLNDNYEVDVKTANGELATANLIAKNFKNKGYDYVVGIGTLAAQSLSNTISDKPVIYAAVSDPVSAGLVSDNVVGISDKVTTIDKQLILLKEKFPTVNKIGVLYNTSELNSVSQIKDLENVAKTMNIEIVKGGLVNASELPQVTKYLIERVDALYIPLDNLVVANVPFVVDLAKKSKKPIIASDNSSVEKGCLFSIGVDYYIQGTRAGQIIMDINDGKDIKSIEVNSSDDTKLYYNQEMAKLFNISFKE